MKDEKKMKWKMRKRLNGQENRRWENMRRCQKKLLEAWKGRYMDEVGIKNLQIKKHYGC